MKAAIFFICKRKNNYKYLCFLAKMTSNNSHLGIIKCPSGILSPSKIFLWRGGHGGSYSLPPLAPSMAQNQ